MKAGNDIQGSENESWCKVLEDKIKPYRAKIAIGFCGICFCINTSLVRNQSGIGNRLGYYHVVVNLFL